MQSNEIFRNVIIGVDGRAGGRDAITLAKQLAAPDARIALAHVYRVSWPQARANTLVLNNASEQLLVQERDATSLDAELTTCCSPSVGRGLHELAERCAADLLVIGSTRHGLLGRVLMSDDTRASLNGAPCAVAIAPSGYASRLSPLAKLGVGYDGSPESDRALAAARELAVRHGSSISALSVVSLQDIPYGEPIPDNWPEVVKQLIDANLRRLHGFEDLDGDATYGQPGEELARFGGKVDLLIVGSRGYGPVGRLFNGSTSNYLAGHARCPLIVVARNGTTARQDTLAREVEDPEGSSRPGAVVDSGKPSST